MPSSFLSSIFTSMPGRRWPTESFLIYLCLSGLRAAIGAHSVSPYPCTEMNPRSLKNCRIAGSMAAPPEIRTLILPPKTLRISLSSSLLRSRPTFLVTLLSASTLRTRPSLPCFLIFFIMLLYRLSKIRGTASIMVGCTSARFFTIYLSPSQ